MWKWMQSRSTDDQHDRPDPRHSRDSRPRKVLAVSSGGGHWVELLRLVPAFADCDVVFVTVREAYFAQVPGFRSYTVPDATRWNKLGLLRLAVKLAWIISWERPDVIISTGAAPGYFSLWFGRFTGARTVWIDSIANVEELSMSGRKAGRLADLWLTQWPHLATPQGPRYEGAVL